MVTKVIRILREKSSHLFLSPTELTYLDISSKVILNPAFTKPVKQSFSLVKWTK
jgi:hypothetical protein